eukprot:1009755-Rhodomonas_salina.1
MGGGAGARRRATRAPTSSWPRSRSAKRMRSLLAAECFERGGGERGGGRDCCSTLRVREEEDEDDEEDEGGRRRGRGGGPEDEELQPRTRTSVWSQWRLRAWQ